MSTDTFGPPMHALILDAMDRIDGRWQDRHRSRPQRLRVFLAAVDELRGHATDKLRFNLGASKLRTKLAL